MFYPGGSSQRVLTAARWWHVGGEGHVLTIRMPWLRRTHGVLRGLQV
jgi:hypothetical protein